MDTEHESEDAVVEEIEDTEDEAEDAVVEEIEDTEDEAEDAVVEEIEDTEDEMEEPAEKTEDLERVDTGKKQSARSGAATYRCTFKREWTAEWPFITVGTTISYYWCCICRHENSCAHQGKADVIRHIKSKAHHTKEQTIQSTVSIAPYYAPASVGGMTTQDAKVLHAIRLLPVL